MRLEYRMPMFCGLLVAVFVIAMYVWTPKTGKRIAVYCGLAIAMWMLYLLGEYCFKR